MKAIGIDIGTTTICGVVLDGNTGEVLGSKTVDNNSSLKSKEVYERIQDPGLILSKVSKIVQEFIESFGTIESIGVTGQMHGILYVNKEGNAVSPLYTWQDGRGDLLYKEGKTYTQYLADETGYHMSTGFGLTTHFYNICNNLVPQNAAAICTIGDYIAMKLSNKLTPVMSISNAASLGCFNLKENFFDFEALKKVNITSDILPEVKHGFELVGKTQEGIPVSTAIGDNQGSFLGSVQDIQNTVLVNVGTGGQVSVGTAEFIDNKLNVGIELRPCTGDNFIVVGSSLCGGSAYAMLEKFFREVILLVPGGNVTSLYEIMNKAMSEKDLKEASLIVSTKFNGTRVNPEERGCISNIDMQNLTPVNMMFGVLRGIAKELYDLYESICMTKGAKASVLVGSGNGIRNNKHLQRIFEELFQLKLRIPAHEEEASYGAALVSLVASGRYESINEAQKLIRYI